MPGDSWIDPEPGLLCVAGHAQRVSVVIQTGKFLWIRFPFTAKHGKYEERICASGGKTAGKPFRPQNTRK